MSVVAKSKLMGKVEQLLARDSRDGEFEKPNVKTLSLLFSGPEGDCHTGLTRLSDLTLLPPSSRLQFPSGATLVVDTENLPCRQAASIVEQNHPDKGILFIKSATHKRGVTAWVEREGAVFVGDDITIFIPPQRINVHA